MRGIRTGLFIWLFLGLATAACQRFATAVPTWTPQPPPAVVPGQSQPPERTNPPARPTTAVLLAAGEFHLPAAAAFGSPGFHEPLNATVNLPDNLGQSEGMQLIVFLWDVNRPSQTCDTEHPLSGCATVDWSDSSSRPNVPAGGVFNNSLTIELASGVRNVFLRESGTLAGAPDIFDPG